jgi:hypothetical protein
MPMFCHCQYFVATNILSALWFKDDYLLNILLMIVWFHLNHFCIDRGFHSRTETEEREFNGSTVHILGAVGNKALLGFLPSPL